MVSFNQKLQEKKVTAWGTFSIVLFIVAILQYGRQLHVYNSNTYLLWCFSIVYKYSVLGCFQLVVFINLFIS